MSLNAQCLWVRDTDYAVTQEDTGHRLREVHSAGCLI